MCIKLLIETATGITTNEVILCHGRFIKNIYNRLSNIMWNNWYLFFNSIRVTLRYGDTLLASNGEPIKVYSIVIRLPVNTHRSFFFYLNIFIFRIKRHIHSRLELILLSTSIPKNIGNRHRTTKWMTYNAKQGLLALVAK